MKEIIEITETTTTTTTRTITGDVETLKEIGQGLGAVILNHPGAFVAAAAAAAQGRSGQEPGE